MKQLTLALLASVSALTAHASEVEDVATGTVHLTKCESVTTNVGATVAGGVVGGGAGAAVGAAVAGIATNWLFGPQARGAGELIGGATGAVLGAAVGTDSLREKQHQCQLIVNVGDKMYQFIVVGDKAFQKGQSVDMIKVDGKWSVM